MTGTQRQLAAVTGVAIILVTVGRLAMKRHEPPLTDAQRAEYAARMEKELAESEQQDLRTFRRLLEVDGYIRDPSPAAEAFLLAHKAELPNLVIKKSGVPDVSLGYGLTNMTLEKCDRQERILRCSVTVAEGHSFEGWAFAGTSARWTGDQYINLPGTIVSAPTQVFGAAELEIVVPTGADLLMLSYRGR